MAAAAEDADATSSFDQNLLVQWEQDLYQTRGIKFVWSTKDVSVIDVTSLSSSLTTGDGDNNTDGNKNTATTRCLIFNNRPHLVQSSIRMDSSSSSNQQQQLPPPLLGETGTHLGGLALSVPLLWEIMRNNLHHEHDAHDVPQESLLLRQKKKAIVIGAGACTVPMVLAGLGGWNVTAVEPSGDVIYAAKSYFGANNIHTTNGGTLELIESTGEAFLSSLVRNADKQSNKCQIFIVDAEDGNTNTSDGAGMQQLTAPPASMQTKHFWRNLVVPCLDNDGSAVIAVNVIGKEEAVKHFQSMLKDALPHHYTILQCHVPKDANVSRRHSLLFALSSPIHPSNLNYLRRRKKSHATGGCTGTWIHLIFGVKS